MTIDDLFISDVVTAFATFPNGRRLISGMIVNFTDDLVVIETDGGDLVGVYPEDVEEIVDRDGHGEREDVFRNDVEADGDALASAGMGTDEDYEHETPLGEELDGGSDLGNDDY